MKLKTIFAALAIMAVFASCAQNSKDAAAEVADGAQQNEAVETANEEPKAPSRALRDSVSYFLGIDYGIGMKRFDFGELNVRKIAKGLSKSQKSKGSLNDPSSFEDEFGINPQLMNETINKYLEQLHAYNAAKAKKEAEAFFKKNLKAKGVQQTESGLQYKIIEEGDAAAKPSAKDTVSVRYCGKLLDGTVFDETKEGDEPVKLVLTNVIKGWQEGIPMIGKGGRIELFIPADLAYGDRGMGPRGTLIFDVELVDVFKCAPAEKPAE